MSDDLEIEQMKKAFRSVDRKGGGHFRREDLTKVFKSLGDWREEELEEIFDAVDTKKEGIVNYHDFVDYVMQSPKVPPIGATRGEEDDEFDDSKMLKGRRNRGGGGGGGGRRGGGRSRSRGGRDRSRGGRDRSRGGRGRRGKRNAFEASDDEEESEKEEEEMRQRGGGGGGKGGKRGGYRGGGNRGGKGRGKGGRKGAWRRRKEKRSKMNEYLNSRVSKDEFMQLMAHLAIGSAEAEFMYNDIEKQSVEAGYDIEEGLKIKWFINDLHIDRKDEEALNLLKEALEKVRAGVEPPRNNVGATADMVEAVVEQAAEEEVVDNGGDDAEADVDVEPEPIIVVPVEETEDPEAQPVDPAELARLATLTEKLGRGPEDAWDVMLENSVLSTAGRQAIMEKYFNDKDAFVAKIQEYMTTPPLLPANAGEFPNREQCSLKVDQLIGRCREAGTKFVDYEFDLENDTARCLYVDGENPGWDCTVAPPAGFKRITELIENPVLFKGGASPGDIRQGQIGTCFLLGALGAIAANKKDAIRRCFIAHDIELGIYGVRFFVDGEWEHVIVDDVMPVDEYDRLIYARSADPDEVWVSILEKAFCKLNTCYEMCDGGRPNQAIYNICGGTSGVLRITDEHKEDPASYFRMLVDADAQGWLLTTAFVERAADEAGSGKCGESVLSTGLVAGHVYSILDLVETEEALLVCCRNPWGTGEWKGMYSDANQFGEWTDTLIEATGWSGADDGRFWMCIEDFVNNSRGAEYARTYGPQWKKMTCRSRFQGEKLQVTGVWDYEARDENELTFAKDDTLEVKHVAPGWWYGNIAGNPDVEGFFPANYVKLIDRPVARYDLTTVPSDGDMDVVVLLEQPNKKMQRQFYARKEDGMNYKDISYPNIQLVVLDDEGKVLLQRKGKRRCIAGELTLEGKRTWQIFALSLDGTATDFSLRVYAKDKDGAVGLREIEGATVEDVTKAIA